MGGGGKGRRYHIAEVNISMGCYLRRKYLPEPKNPNSLKALSPLASAVCRKPKTLKRRKALTSIVRMKRQKIIP